MMSEDIIVKQQPFCYTEYKKYFENRKCRKLDDEGWTRHFWLTHGYLPACKDLRCKDCHETNVAKWHWRIWNDVNYGAKRTIETVSDSGEIRREKVPFCDVGYNTNMPRDKNTFVSAFVLPYYGLLKNTRYNANLSFRQWMRDKFGASTYVCTTEKQSKLLHINYLWFSLQPVDYAVVGERWLFIVNRLLAKASRTTGKEYRLRDTFTGKAEPCNNLWCWISYILKSGKHAIADLESYIPAKDEKFRPVDLARNWNQFWGWYHYSSCGTSS